MNQVKSIQSEKSSKLLKILDEYPELNNLCDQKWRMKNLYFIKDKQGNKVKFTPNWAQQELLDCGHTCIVVLKARQLGITTFYCIKLLDEVLWNDYCQAGIIAHTLSDAQSLFVDKLKFTFDHLHPALRALFRTVGDSAKELRFSHGSTIRVGTSLRSSTLNFLHISELGKICAKFPEKAREVISGALQTIAPGQHCYIESTAEGREGFYHDLCVDSMSKKNRGEQLTKLDYSFHFFPWWKEEITYSLDLQTNINISKELNEYFDKLDLRGIKLSDSQKNWYAKKKSILQDDMTREYPSYPEEAFEASQVGNWYASQLKELYDNGHITDISYDKSIPVFTAFDLGQADATSIWFFQVNRAGEVMVIDYFERSDTPIDQIVQMLNQKGYTYGLHIWPHDARARDRAGITFEDQARDFNLSGIVLESHSILDGINLVRTTLSKMWFDKTKCKTGLQALANYKKKWNTQIGGFTSQEVHDSASHGAAAMRYLCAGLPLVANQGSIENDYNAIRSFFGS